MVRLVASDAANEGTVFEQALPSGWDAGRGRSSDALTKLAVEVRDAPSNVAYLFPDWGFFTSFAFLTGNRVRYAVDVEPGTIAKLKRAGITEFRLVYWNASDQARYRTALTEAGVADLKSRDFMSRERAPVSYWLQACATVRLSAVADAVATTDVPACAVVKGNSARLSGYVDQDRL